MIRISTLITTSFFALFFLLSSSPTFGQYVGGKHHILLKSGVQIPEPNRDAVLSGPQIVKSEQFDGYYYRLIQFEDLPLDNERTNLEATGLELLDYFPNLTYLARIPVAYELAQLGGFNIRGIYEFEGDFKISPVLRQLPLPDWAVPQAGKVDLIVQFIEGNSVPKVRSGLEAAGFEILSKHPIGNYFNIRVSDSEIDKVAALPFVLYVENIMPPAEPENYTGRTLHRASALNNETGIGRQYDGHRVVIGVGDDGGSGPHIDFSGRLDNTAAGWNTGNHGDHITGTIMGAGNLDPKQRGMAPGAIVHAFSVWDAVDFSPNTHVQDSLMVTSTSYGNGCNAGYTSYARTADQTVRQNPALIHVFSCGNSGGSDCGYGAGTGWGNITGGIKIGKNVIAVGNVNQDDMLAGSSSRGPSDDGRIKPDVCAKGTSVKSTNANNQYAVSSGTSMAAPGVTGTLALLHDAHRRLNGGLNAESPLLKACLMNTAEDLGNPGPDFRFGYGRINALRAVKTLEENRYLSDDISTAQSHTHSLTVPAGTAELRLMLYWLDWEGAAGASMALVNNLDLLLTDPSQTDYQPWILDNSPNAAALNQPAVRGMDINNNVEQVTLDAPLAGSYTVTVSGGLIPQGPQKYYLLWEFRDSNATMEYPNGGESFKPGEQERIRWDAAGDWGTFDLDYSTDGGATWNSITTGVSGSARQYTWQVPYTPTGKAMLKVKRGTFEAVSDNHFSILSVPANLQIASNCANYCELSFNPVTGATEYVGRVLGAMYMDSVALSTGSPLTITGLNPGQSYWLTVNALGPDNAVSRRAIAVERGPGIFNCNEPNDVAMNKVLIPGESTLLDCIGLDNVNVKVELKNYSPNTLTGIPVYYQVNGGPVVSETFNDTLPGFATIEYIFTSATEDFSVAGVYDLAAWVDFGPDQNPANDSIMSVTTVVASALNSLPYSEDFESFTNCGTNNNCEGTNCFLWNGWHNVQNGTQDDVDWRTDNGGTPTNGTGPDIDHNPGTGNGKYIYLEASGDCEFKMAHGLTPCLDLTTVQEPEFKFWFHLFGQDMGELHVDLNHGGAWVEDVIPPMIANWFNFWWEGTVDLTPYVGEIVFLRFRGIIGDDFASDMALDDINAYDKLATSIDSDLKNSGVVVFPNPGNGEFNVGIKDMQGESADLQVFDLGGRSLMQMQTESQVGAWTGKLDLSGFSAGIYYLKVEHKGKTSFLKLGVQ